MESEVDNMEESGYDTQKWVQTDRILGNMNLV